MMDEAKNNEKAWQKKEWNSWEEYSGEPLDEENEEYIQKLKDDVILYVTFPKPRGYGGAPTINGISAEISGSISILSKWGRMDVLAWIYQKFAAVHSVLRPVRFSTWMIELEALEPDHLAWLFQNHPEIFKTFVLDEWTSKYDLCRVGQVLAESQEIGAYLDYRDMVFKFYPGWNPSKEPRLYSEDGLSLDSDEEMTEDEETEENSSSDPEADSSKEQLAQALAGQDALSFSFLRENGVEIARPFSRDVFLMNTRVNGTSHVGQIHKIAASIDLGDEVQLILEPDNPYDPYAILVKTQKGSKLGYIPQKKNEVLYHLLNAGKRVYGVVSGGEVGDFVDEDNPWVPIFIEVFMKD